MEFLKEYAWAAAGVVMVVEYLIAKSKLESNSIIEVSLSIIKMVFGLDKDKKLK
jgi:hypothetical protein